MRQRLQHPKLRLPRVVMTIGKLFERLVNSRMQMPTRSRSLVAALQDHRNSLSYADTHGA